MLVIEDLVDFTKDPLEGASILSSSKVFLASSYHFGDEFTDTVASLPSISGPSCSRVMLSEVTPSILELADQLLLPSTLNFVCQSLYSSLGLCAEDLPSSVSSHMHFEPSSDPVAPGSRPSVPALTLPPSDNFTEVPPHFRGFPLYLSLGRPGS